jgi:hypothetical protein
MEVKTNLEVRKISYHDALPMINNIHYARRVPSIQFSFGLFDGETMIGVVTYGQPASPSLCKGIAGDENRNKVLELNRLVLISNSPKNSASMLVGRSLKQLPKNMFIVSYADAEGWGHVGYVYQATNWLYTGMTKRRTDIYAGGKHARHYEEKEKRRQIRTAKHRYVYLTGNKKKQLKELKYPVYKDYPKGDSRKYDVSNPTPLEETGIAIKVR